MKQSILLTLVALLTTNISQALDLALDSHTVKRPDGSDLEYHIGQRADAGRQPILLIAQGSDCNSVVQHPSIDAYTNVAPDHAVLYIEKYGITKELPWGNDDARAECPEAYIKHNTLQQRVLDNVQVIAELRRNAPWWDGNLTILGGSAGTFIGERVATLVPETRRLVIFGFGSRNLETDVLTSIRASFEEGDMPEAVKKQQLAEITGMFQEMRSNPTPNKAASGHSYSWWASMFSFDQLVALQQVPVPTLAIQGSIDQDASPEGARTLINDLRELGNKNVEYKEYEGLDHGFKDSDGHSKKHEVIADIREWLQQER